MMLRRAFAVSSYCVSLGALLVACGSSEVRRAVPNDVDGGGGAADGGSADGSTARDDGGGSGGRGAGGAPQDGGATSTVDASVDASPDASTSTDAAPGVPFDTDAACTDFTAPPTTTPSAIRITNNTGEDLFIGPTQADCSYYLGFTAETLEGKPLKVSREVCERTCGEQQSQSCACDPPCQPPVVTLISPGQHYDVGWPGTVFTAERMPSRCFQDQSCSDSTCLVERGVTGPVTIKVVGWTAATCTSGVCTCTTGVSGSCIVPTGTGVTGTQITAQATWNGENRLVVDVR